MKIEFIALIKQFQAKALISLDKGYEVKIQSGDSRIKGLTDAPADKECKVTVEWDETT